MVVLFVVSYILSLPSIPIILSNDLMLFIVLYAQTLEILFAFGACVHPDPSAIP
jgi:hypothetical protein